MSLSLRSVIGPRRPAVHLVDAVAAALGSTVAVEDLNGRVLHGANGTGGDARHPVESGGTPFGWVSGGAAAPAVASLLSHLLTRESEQRALGSEVLHLYREVNLIYSFSEKLAAQLDTTRVAELTLTEARHLIKATDGAILLLDEESGTLSLIAGFGEHLTQVHGLTRGVGIIGSIAQTGIGEIVEDVEADPRRVRSGAGVHSLLCAPLKAGERVIGVIGLGSTVPAAYTAAELKLLNTLAMQTATAIENARLFERTIRAAREREELLAAKKALEVSQAKMEHELQLAAQIQANLFPTELPVSAALDLAARNRPARQCGGDHYDALVVEGDGGRQLLLCVADVSGKGMPAALLMSNMQATLRALLGRTETLPQLASQASDLLYGSTAGNKYVTAAFLQLDLDARHGSGRFVSAGHVDCLLVKADGTPVRLTSTGAPLGLLPPGLPFDETTVSIDVGDCVVLFSDGVPDAQNEAGEEFGDERLLAIVQQARTEPSSAIVERVFSAIDAFAGSAAQFDDITLFVVRRTR
ncbi:MAG: GAF domain-containing SpoIIE family protein phosphatase [Vicinamibacterales bacterium]